MQRWELLKSRPLESLQMWLSLECCTFDYAPRQCRLMGNQEATLEMLVRRSNRPPRRPEEEAPVIETDQFLILDLTVKVPRSVRKTAE